MKALGRLAIAVVAVAAVLFPAAALGDPTVEYFPVPEARGIGGGMTVDSSGNVWFGAANASPVSAEVPPLGRLVPSLTSAGTSSGLSYFPTPALAGESPCCSNQIRDVAFDPTDGGRVWFIRSTGAVGFGEMSAISAGTTNGMHVAATPGFPDLGSIAIKPDGEAWFTESSSSNVSPYPGNRVAHTDQTLTIGEYPDLWHQVGGTDASRYAAGPAGITIGKEGAPWFAESSAGFPGYRIAKAVGGEYQEYLLTPCQAPPLSCSGTNTGRGPWSVATAPDGSIWFTNILKNAFGKLDPVAGTITQYSLPGIDPNLSGGEPWVIRAAPDGTLWLAEHGFISHPNANALVRIVPTDPPTATVFPLGANHAPISLAPDADGNIWFGVADVVSMIGRLGDAVGPVPPDDGDDGGSGGSGGTGGTGGGGSALPTPPPGQIVVRPGSIGQARIGQPRGDSLEVNQICIGPPQEPCALVYLLDAHEYVTGFPGTKPRASISKGGRKTKTVVVGTKSVTVPGGGSAKVTIKLNAAGRKILKRDGTLHATLHVTQKQKKGKAKVLTTKKVTFKPGK